MEETEEKKEEKDIEGNGGPRNRKEILIAYLPAVLSALCAVVTVVLYSTVIEVRHWDVYFDQIFMALVQFAIVFINRKFRLGIPYYLVALMALHYVLSVDMGTSLGFYGRISWWDSFVHCMFGFLAAATLYYLIPRLYGRKANFFDVLAIVLIVLSFAALWELFEYVMSMILKSDMQDVARLLSEHKNPLGDTMFDMALAIIGSSVFFICLFVIRWIKRKVNGK